MVENPCNPYNIFVENLLKTHLAELIFGMTTIADNSIFIKFTDVTADELYQTFMTYGKVVGEFVANLFDVNVKRDPVKPGARKYRPKPVAVKKEVTKVAKGKKTKKVVPKKKPSKGKKSRTKRTKKTKKTQKKKPAQKDEEWG